MTLDLIKIRRDLHQIPEIGLEEFETQAYLLERIAEITAGKEFVEQRTWRTETSVEMRLEALERIHKDLALCMPQLQFEKFLVTQNGVEKVV